MVKRAGGVLPAALRLDRSLPRALEKQLYAGLWAAILSGRMRAGTRLPSSRSVADELGVSRNTVIAAFGQLSAGA